MFPKSFRILITDEVTGTPIKNIAIGVTIFANLKNNYFFVPHISNNEGVIEFSKELMEKEIDLQRNLFIMDYSSTLADCKPKIKLDILTNDSINKLITAMKIYSDTHFHNDINNMQKVDNYRYEPKSQIINLKGDKLICYNLKLRKKQDG